MSTHGRRVRLNSGGPEMVIVASDGERVRCAWLDNRGERHEEEYPWQCVTPCGSEWLRPEEDEAWKDL